MSTCKRHLNFWGAAEFSSVVNIFVLHPGRGCCFSLGASRFNCFPLRYHHNIGGWSITRYRSDAISAPFFVVWNVIKVSTKWCYTITKIYDLLQFFLTAFFFVRWNLCTTSFATSFSDFDEKDANHGRHRSYSSICVSTLCFLGWYRIGLISNVTTRSGHPHFLSLTESLF